MTTHHTPGPWYASPHISALSKTIDIGGADNSNVAVALTGDNVASTKTAFANARLIASAPQLANGLRHFLDAYEGNLLEGDDPCLSTTVDEIASTFYTILDYVDRGERP